MSAPDIGYLHSAMFNGTIGDSETLKISPLGSGFMFGEGVFETVRVRQARLPLLAAHHTRLTAALVSFGTAPPSDLAQLQDRCQRLCTANSLAEGSVKIVVFREAAGWSEMILARPAIYGEERYTEGFRLQTVTSDLRVDPRHAVKSLNYLANLHAKRTAQAAGFDEPLFLDPHGHILEGATTNLFAVQAGLVCTPPLRSGILPGVMRAEAIRALGPAVVREHEIGLEELWKAGEVFVTNALLGVMPVAQIDTHAYDLARNPVTRSLMTRFK